MTDASTFALGNLFLILSDDNGNRMQLVLNSLNDLLPGEYSKAQLNVGSSTVTVGGGFRKLDANDPGSFTVKYDVTTGFYTIEGMLNLTPNASYPSVNVVVFEYMGTL